MTMIEPVKFVTDGLRGRAGEAPIDPATLRRVGAALGTSNDAVRTPLTVVATITRRSQRQRASLLAARRSNGHGRIYGVDCAPWRRYSWVTYY